MSTYVYRCADCGETCERVEGVSEHGEAKPTCPKCKSGKIQNVIAPIFAKTSTKS